MIGKAIQMVFPFIPQDPEFPQRLIDQAALLQQAAEVFQKIASDWSLLQEGARKLKHLEHSADQIVHAINVELEKVWLPDVDKQDPKFLVELIDDVIDHIEEAANRLVLFEIPCATPELHKISAHLVEVAQTIHEALVLLRKNQWKGEQFEETYKKIHTIENKGDEIHRSVLPHLFNLEHQINDLKSQINDLKSRLHDESIAIRDLLVEILALSEQSLRVSEQNLRAQKFDKVYQGLENALDKAEDVAIVLEHIRIKGGPRWKFSFF